MYRGIEVLRLLPDRPGRGGTKFGYHSFQQEPINDTRETLNVHVWQDSWRSDNQGVDRATGYNFVDDSDKDIGEAASLALHGYSVNSLTDPTEGPTTLILGHNITSQGGVTFGYIWNYTVPTNGTYNGMVVPPRWDATTNKLCNASYTHPAVFVDVGNRCFIATGINEGYIYDIAGRNDFTARGPGNLYTIGVDAPKAAPPITSAGVVKSADIYLRETSKYISNPDPLSALANATVAGADTLQVISDGVDWNSLDGTGIDIADGTDAFSSSAMTVSIPNGSDIATFVPFGSIPTDNEWVGLTLTVSGYTFVMMAFGNATPAESPALGTDECKLSKVYRNGKLPYDPGGGGGGFDPAQDINDQPFSVTGVRYTMKKGGIDKLWGGGVTPGLNTTTGSLVNTGGLLTWEELPPSYAYAWYDPITGHVSNISPVFTPTDKNETLTGIKLNVDVGSISYPPSTSLLPTGSTRWTHILFFRTLMAGGSTLYPIGSLQPTLIDESGAIVANPEWKGLPNEVVPVIPPPVTTDGSYWFDTARDADLLISGALRAPQFTNGKPTITQQGETTVLFPSHMAYWDGRLWMAATQDPAAVHYSCDRVQCPFGIPEESFPETNVLRIPASDGAVRGMKLIGESLLVTTDRWAYTIVGNNEANYRLVRVSTRMAGVGDYQMAEFVSDVEGQSTLVVFVGTDAKVYAMPLGGQATHISKEIQTFLDTARLEIRTQYARVRVHCTSINGRRLAIIYCPSANSTFYPPATAPGKTFMYDFDQKVWTVHTLIGTPGFSSGSESGIGISWASLSTVGSNGEEVYSVQQSDVNPPISPVPRMGVVRWMDPSYPLPMPGGYVRTFPLTFDGKKTRKQLHFVRIYVNNESYTTIGSVSIVKWTCEVRVNSSSTAMSAEFNTEPDVAYNQLAGGAPVDISTAKELVATAAQLAGDTGPIIGYTFDVTVDFPGRTDRIYQLYAIEIGYSTLSDGQVDI